ncbi:MAG: cation diffusion facilitator family transporter [Bacteroidota bacterium]|nr:cation diffusion facilitator family transporter [Bacteroidota bacterium]
MKWQFDKYLVQDSEGRQKRFALKWALSIGGLVTVLKFYAWFITNSNSILSDGLESLINLAAGAFALYSLQYALRPRDAKHPFGHGKMEFLASTLQGGIIFAAGFLIVGKAIYNFYYPNAIGSIDVGIVLVLLGAGVNLAVGYYLRNKGRQLDSLTLQSDSKRLLTDAYSSLALAVGLVSIFLTGIYWIDSVLAILSGIVIVYTGYKLAKQSVKGLLDTADTKMLEEIVKVLQNYSKPEWIDLQNMRASHYGMYVYVDCQLTLPWYWNLLQVHAEEEKLDVLVNKHFRQRVEFFIHSVPCRPTNCGMCRVSDCSVRQHAFSGKRLQPVSPLS